MPRSEPSAEAIARRGKGTEAAEGASGEPAAWSVVAARLREKGPYPGWLATVGKDGAPHVRPVFGAWGGESFFIASKRDAVKSRNMEADERCSISADTGPLHIVVEGRAKRVADAATLEAASRAMEDVYSWTTRVEGDKLDADYGAPTSGGPPYDVYELTPTKGLGYPTGAEFEPTRWRF